MEKQKAIASLVGLPQNAVTAVSPFIARPGDTASILFDPGALDDWLSVLEDQDQMVSFFIVAADDRQFDDIKTAVEELLGPQIVHEEEKRPLSALKNPLIFH